MPRARASDFPSVAVEARKLEYDCPRTPKPRAEEGQATYVALSSRPPLLIFWSLHSIL